MARIVPELNLNKVPQSAKNNSLILSKNIKTNEDGVIERDTPIEYIFSMYKDLIPTTLGSKGGTIYNHELLGHIVGINHKIYFFIKKDISGIEVVDNNATAGQINKRDYIDAIKEVKIKDKSFDSYLTPVSYCPSVCRNVNVKGNNRIVENEVGNLYEYIITEYNEETKEFKNIESAWTWSGGIIDGCVINNNTTDEILVIAEYNDDIDINIPIKFINLTEGKHSKTDDESIYTQTPKIPITNLQYLGKFNCNIPTGVYQFFIRYKINEYLYTNWFSCSGELFTGDKKKESTVQGTCIHLLSKDVSSRSFKFVVNHLLEEHKSLYKSFQLGFIISNNDSINAREWKTFDIDTDIILFDYKQEDIKEANIDDFLNPQFNIFNPKNIIYFKNRLYCSNYKTFDYDNFEDPNTYNPNADIKRGYHYIETDENSNNLYLGGVEIEIDNNFIKPKDRSINVEEFVKSNIDLLYTKKNTESHTITYNRKDEYPLYGGVWGSPTVSMKYENNILHIASTDEDTPSSQDLNANIILGNYNPIISLKAYNGDDVYDINANVYKNANYYESDDLIKHCIENNDSKNYINIIKSYISKLDEDLNAYVTIDNIPRQITYFECKYITDFNITFQEIDNYIDGIKEPWLSILRGVLGALTIGGITAVPIAGTAVAGIAQWLLDKYSATQYVKHKATITYKVNTIELYPKSKHDIVNNYNPSELDYTTLNPFCKYEYYVHYVSDKGFVTNGKKIGTNSFLPRTPFSDAAQMIAQYNKYAIYPQLDPTKYRIPTGFVGLFFSIYKQPLDACQLVNIVQNGTKYRGECYELDALIVKGLANIIIKDSKGIVVSNSANYYSSNTTTPLNHFGCYGYIEWDETEYRSSENYDVDDEDNFRFAIFNDSDETNIENRDDIKELIRITPYIIPNNENNKFSYNDYTLPGYICEVKKLDEITKLADAVNVIQLNNVYVYNGEGTSGLPLGRYYIDTTRQAVNGQQRIYKTVEVKAMGQTYTALDPLDIFLNKGIYLIHNSNYSLYYFQNKFIPKTGVDKIHVVEVHTIDVIDNEDVDTITYTDSYYEYDNSDVSTIIVSLDSTLYTDGNTIGILEKTYNESGYSNVTFDTSAFDVTGANIISAETPYLLKSSFNLNYLSIIADSEVLIKFFTPEGIVPNNNESNNENNESEGNRNRYLLPLVPSLEVSNLLELTKTFREYTRKTYSVVRKENLTKFNNTVIASNTNVDEAQQYIFTFSPLDYYNIPTNRGEIVKLISLSNTLYAHCSQGMFKFNGNNQLSTTNEDINLKENDIFISGCLSVYDSIYGYGGLYKKSHSIVTFDFYIFYDKLINTIYTFDGNNIKPISINIKKLLENYTPDDILFSYDYINKRIFINLIKVINNTRTNICLSYSFISNSIISIHDMDYMSTFSSRISCYFIDYNTEKLNCYKTKEIHKDSDSYNPIKVDALPVTPSENDSIIWIGTNQTINNVEFIYNHVYTYSSTAWHHEGYIYDIENDSGIPNFNKLYGNLCKQSYIVHYPIKDFTYATPSIIDVIVNENYEQIKALNSVSWIISKILDYFNNDRLNSEHVNELFPGNEILIYTDQTNTGYYEITFDDIDSMGQRKISPYGESKPTYNCGIWTINDFRDIKNIPTGITPSFDNKSLLYGKYFVIRFVIYNDNFRLENLSINSQNYEKI